jgi:peroxiredoxin
MKDATAAPLLDALTTSKELPQEKTVVSKSLTVPPAKGTPTCASKRLKKTVAVGTSLEAHQPVASSKDVSIASVS